MDNTLAKAMKRLDDLQPFIQYLQDTSEDEWQVDVVRSVGNTRNCLFGHLVNWYYGKDYEGNISPIWDAFEARWSSTYVIYPINDGKDMNYPQNTPKQRVLAYMRNLWLGQEEDTVTAWENEAKRHGHA